MNRAGRELMKKLADSQTLALLTNDVGGKMLGRKKPKGKGGEVGGGGDKLIWEGRQHC